MEEKIKSKKDVYSIVTDRIIAMLEKGTVPWKKPWDSGIPRNFITMREYRGINVWLLIPLGYSRNYFLTVKQLTEHFNGRVKQGEKGYPIVFWNWKEVTDESSGETKQIPFLRYYVVFNIEQCEGIPLEKIPSAAQMLNPIKKCEEIIDGMPKKPVVQFKEQKAYYNPLLDFINMPKMKSFSSSGAYYETLFHELVHSTGHITRLNRKELMEMAEFGGESYSIEELVAELGASYLKFTCRFDANLETNASYIQAWLSKLKNDKHFIIYAAGKAQNAVDFILNVKLEEGKEIGSEESKVLQ